ncbi:unnamed protein product [Porites evermanni]|uniref:Mutator-like transposase domain-containing protein n=1 Tax=Porites evermanni TaxID=104178 RepID=A0ABN8M4P5_9CNID|nr:unnamed protein product [Porites evermanni]
MEVAGVLTLYKRTPEGIRYSPFVGDGDSKSYSQLEQAAPYGRSFHKPKEDCIAHVTKRMGTNLRKKVAEYKGRKTCSKMLYSTATALLFSWNFSAWWAMNFLPSHSLALVLNKTCASNYFENGPFCSFCDVCILGKKLADGRKGLGGVGGLTTKRIDSMQGWYGQAIRNKGDAKAMSKATHAI